jgi:hypothetical protein
MATLIQWQGPLIGESWDSTRVYRSDEKDTGYALISEVTPITTTKYWDVNGTPDHWYKISFFDAETSTEGPYSSPFQITSTSTEVVRYTNPTELRKFMQFDPIDFPNDEDTTLLISQAHTQLFEDIKGVKPITDVKKLKLISLFLSSVFVLRSLAMKALSKGYVAVSLEGGNIQKAFAAMMQQADYMYERYQEQLAKDTVDVAFTKFLEGNVSEFAETQLRETFTGISNVKDFDAHNMPSLNRRISQFQNR